jgi:hypothetical protein
MNGLFRRLREAATATSTPELQRGGKVRENDDEDLEESAGQTCPDCTDGITESGAKCEECDGGKLREAAPTLVEVPHLQSLLREAAVTRIDGEDGDAPLYEVTIIREGLGNPEDKNYYTADALREAAAAGIWDGLQAYGDHPTRTEERDLPERSIRKLIGYYKDSRFVEGNVAEVKATFVPIGGAEGEHAVALIEASLKAQADTGKPLVGISIDAGGTVEPGEHNGTAVNFVRRITEASSADMVTKAGAGGGFHRRLMESLRGLGASRPGHQHDQEVKVTMKPNELQKKVEAATAKLREALATMGAAETEDKVGDAFKQAREAEQELQGLAGQELEVQIREVEKPVAASDDEKDQLAARLKEAEQQRDSEKDRAEKAETKATTYERTADAINVLREAKVEDGLREKWLPEILERCDSKDQMVRFVESRQAEIKAAEDAAVKRMREAFGEDERIEGAGARLRETETGGGRSLADDIGVEEDELATAEEEPAAA